ncbi:MAG: hypothetical protein KatS3mg027_0422 [Bacteroidia bacterium]|nr:MAG: hypothetical protein KatS3mg027_0422 [Bacteroidia bacterium]
MELIKSRSIILQVTQIKDFKYIVKFLSEKEGLHSGIVEVGQYIQHGHLQVPGLCELIYFQNRYKKNEIKEVKPFFIFKNIFKDVRKNVLSQFIVEIVLKTHRDGMHDIKLFNLMQSKLIELDDLNENILFYHLFFLKEFINISGHYPYDNFNSKECYFSLNEGKFIGHQSNTTLNAEDSQIWHQFFFSNNALKLDFPIFKLTHYLIEYLKFHLSLSEVQSLPFLKETILENDLME